MQSFLQLISRFRLLIICVVLIPVSIYLLMRFPIKSLVNNSQNTTLLTVVGEGKVKAPPELAQFTLSYATVASTSADALSSEKQLRDKIISRLTGLYKVDDSDIQVQYPKVSPVTSTLRVLYQSTNTMDVSFSNLNLLDQAISKLYQTGDIVVNSVVFTTKNPRELEDKAITEAFKDAKLRAEKMAQASEKKLGKLVSIAGNQTQSVGTTTRDVLNQQNAAKDLKPGQLPEIKPGQIELVRTVTLVYELN